MRLKGLILDPTSDVPVVILREIDGSVFLPIWIGVFEANAIALALEGIRTQRPMTHDLLQSCLAALDARLERVEIHSLIEGTFHARLRLALRPDPRPGSTDERPPGLEVDSRPSDAIALALRTGAPIWIARTVLDGALSSRRASEVPAADEDDRKLREWLENARPEDLGKYRM
jgi:bifunctional DNase/RNase